MCVLCVCLCVCGVCVPVCCFHFSAINGNLLTTAEVDSKIYASEEPTIPTADDMQVVQNAGKKKRSHTAYSNHQIDQLELTFSKSHYRDIETLQKLASDLSINEDRIKVYHVKY